MTESGDGPVEGWTEAGPDPRRAGLPAVVRVNATIVRRGFWGKIRGLVSEAPFAEDALALWFCAFDRQTPPGVKAMLLAALAFFVVPKRFLPRQLPGLKLADDAAVIGAAMAALGQAVQPRHRARARRILDGAAPLPRSLHPR